MINPRGMAVLTLSRVTHQFELQDVSEYRDLGQEIEIVFTHSHKRYSYRREHVRIIRDPRRRVLTEGERVEANGTVWTTATEIVTFTSIDGAWSRIFYRKQAAEAYRAYPASRVRVVTSATEAPAVADVLRYWRAVVARLPGDDPLRPGYDTLDFVHPESALNSFLSGSPIESRPPEITPIFPFRCNLSQRAAVEKALTGH